MTGAYTLKSLDELLSQLALPKSDAESEFAEAEGSLKRHFDMFLRRELQDVESRVTSALRRQLGSNALVSENSAYLIAESSMRFSERKNGVSEIFLRVDAPSSKLKKPVLPSDCDVRTLLRSMALKELAQKASADVAAMNDEALDSGGEEMSSQMQILAKIDRFASLLDEAGGDFAKPVCDAAGLRDGGWDFAVTSLLSALGTSRLSYEKYRNDAKNRRVEIAEYDAAEDARPDEHFALSLDFDAEKDVLSLSVSISAVSKYKTTMEKIRPALVEFLRRICV